MRFWYRDDQSMMPPCLPHHPIQISYWNMPRTHNWSQKQSQHSTPGGHCLSVNLSMWIEIHLPLGKLKCFYTFWVLSLSSFKNSANFKKRWGDLFCKCSVRIWGFLQETSPLISLYIAFSLSLLRRWKPLWKWLHIFPSLLFSRYQFSFIFLFPLCRWTNPPHPHVEEAC